MSTSIEQRVVQMRFDNKQFENGAAQTMSTLDKLKEKLNFKGAVKGVDDINKKINDVSLDPLIKDTDKVGKSFDAMAVVAISALNRVTNMAITAGSRMAKALTLDPVMSGFSEYETKMNSIQTIMSNTASKGTTMADVTRVIDELNAYADKTIYNFAEMTRNIGTFTAAGVDLEKSAKAIQGIANLAAASGSNSQQASTAMYQLSQALASGTVKLMDWNSVVNAGMGGEKFQNALKQTAREHGIAVDAIIEKEGSFRESLSQGWISADILNETLKKFTVEGAKEYSKAMVEAGKYTQEQADALVKEAQAMEDAATKVKTFTQLWSTLQEAAQSGWGKTWEIIIGDFEEAKELLTRISNVVGGFINASSDARNEILQTWKELGGRQLLIDAISIAFENLLKVIKNLKDGFKDIFPPVTAEQLYNATLAIKNFVEDLKLSDEAINTLRVVFKGLLLPVKAFVEALKVGIVIVGGFIKIVFKLIDSLIALPTLIGTINDPFKKLFGDERYNRIVKALAKIIDGLGDSFFKIRYRIRQLIQSFSDMSKDKNIGIFDRLLDTLKNIGGFVLDRVVNGFELLAKIDFSALGTAGVNAIDSIVKGFKNLTTFVKDAKNIVVDFFSNLNFANLIDIFNIVGEGFTNFIDIIKDFIKTFSFKEILDEANEGFSSFKDIVGKVAEEMVEFTKKLDPSKILIFTFGVALISLVANISKVLSALSKAVETVKGTFTIVNTILREVANKIKASKILQVASALVLLTVALIALAKVDPEGLKQATISIVSLMGALTIVIALLSVINKFLVATPEMAKGLQMISTVAAAMAGSIFILSGALFLLSKVDLEGMGQKLLTLFAILTSVIVSMGVLSKFAKSSKADALVILAFAASVSLIVLTLCKISKEDVEFSLKTIGTLLLVMLALKALANFGKGIKIKDALGMIIFAQSLISFAKILTKLNKYDTLELLRGLLNFIPVFLTIKLVVLALGKAGTVQDFGKNVLGIAISMLILYKAIEKIGSMDAAVLLKGGAAVSALILIFGLMQRLAGKSGGAVKMTGSFLAMSAAIIILGYAINYIGNLELKAVYQGTAVVAALLLLMGLLASSLGSTKRSTGAIVAITACLGLILSAIALLTLIDDPKGLYVAVGAISTTFVAIGAMIKLIGNFKIGSALSSLALLTVVIVELGIAFTALNDLNPEQTLITATALSEVMLALAGTTRLFSNIKGTAGDFGKTFGVLLVMLAMAGSMVAILNQMQIEEGLFEKVSALSLLLGALAGITIAIDKLGLGGKGSVGKEAAGAGGIAAVTGIILALFLAIGGLFAGFEAAGINLNEILGKGIDTINSMYRAIPAIAVMAAVAKAAQMLGAGGLASIGAGASGAATIDAVFAIITTLVLGIGALFEHTDWEKYIDKAIIVFPKIGQAIGGLVGGFGEGLVSGFLTSFATDMSTFMTNFQPFLNSLKNITSEKVDAVGNLAKMLLTLSAVDLATSIINFFNIFGTENSLASFGDQLVEFGPKIAEFGESIKNINTTKITAVATLMSSLAEILAQIPTEGGILDWIFGHKDFEGFGKGLSGLATGLKDFIKEVDNANITEEAVEKVKTVTTVLTELANNIPRSGGILDAFFGSKDMGVFGTQLQTFATGLAGFFKIISGQDPDVGAVNIDDKLAEKAANVGKAFTDFANAIPSTGGKLQIITGIKDMAGFGEQLKGYATALVGFFRIISGQDKEVGQVNIDKDLAQKAADIGEAFANLTKKLPGTGGKWQAFAGEVDLGAFGTDLAMFGAGMALFFQSLKGQEVTQDDVDTATNAGTAFTNLVNNIKPNSGVLTGFLDVDLSKYGTQLEDLGEGLGKFYSNVKDIVFDTVNKAVTEIQNILGLNEAIKNVNVNSANVFSTYLNNLATSSLDKFGEAFDNGTEKLTNKITETLKLILKNASDNIGQSSIDFSGLMNAVSNSIMQGKSIIETRAFDIANWFKDAFIGNSAAFKECGQALVQSLVDEMGSKLDSSISRVKDMFDDIVESVEEVFDIKNGVSNKFKKFGENCVDGFVKGFSLKSIEANSKIRTMSTNFVNTAANAMGVHSPSTKFEEIGMYCMQGLINGIGNNEHGVLNRAVKMGENLLNSIREFFGINSPSTVTRDEVGTYIVEGIAEGIKNDTSAEEAAEIKARNIVEAFQKEFDKLDQVLNTKNLEYELWQSMNPTATFGEANVKQIEMLDEHLKNQAERVSLANAEYQATLIKLGENADQTKDAYNTYLEEKITLADLANELSELQKTNEEAYRSFSMLYNSNYDMLSSMGFTREEISKAYKDQTGWVDSDILSKVGKNGSIEDIMNNYMKQTIAGSEEVQIIFKETFKTTTEKAVEEASLIAREGGRNTIRSFNQGVIEVASKTGTGGEFSVENAIDNVASSVKDALPGIEEGQVSGGNLIKGIEQGIDDASTWLTNAGSTASEKVGGIIDWFNNQLGEHSPSIYTKESGINLILGLVNGILDPTVNSTVSDSATTVSTNILSIFEEYSQKYNDVGVQMMRGLANGIASGKSSVIDSAVTVATQTLTKVEEALGVHSPSREFYRIGKMIDQGLSNGLMDDYSIVDGSISRITDRIQQSEEDFIIEPIIDMKNVEDGVSDINSMFDDLYILQWNKKGQLIPTYAGYQNDRLALDTIRTLSVDKKTYEAAMKAAYPNQDAIAHKAYNTKLTAEEERLLVDLWRQGVTQADNIITNDGRGVYTQPIIQYSQNITSPTPANAAEIARRTNNALNKIINGSNQLIHSGTNNRT